MICFVESLLKTSFEKSPEPPKAKKKKTSHIFVYELKNLYINKKPVDVDKLRDTQPGDLSEFVV